MLTPLTDLYIIVHEFYQTREKSLARINAEVVCLISLAALFFNLLQIIEWVTGGGKTLPYMNRRELWVFSLAAFFLMTVSFRFFVWRHSVLSSEILIEKRSGDLTNRRKAVIFAAALANILAVFIIAELK